MIAEAIKQAQKMHRTVIEQTYDGTCTIYSLQDVNCLLYTSVDSGRLRDSWRIEGVQKIGGEYVAEIINSMEYASYVENGHRQEPGRFVPAIGKRLVKSYVPGKYMLRISEQEVQKEADKIVQRRIEREIGDLFG